MKLEKQACMLALAAILLLIVGAFVVGFPAGATLAEETDIDLNAFKGSVILDDPVYFQEATPDEPEVKPTQQPTIEPTQAPGEQPTVEPTHEPTAEPAMDAKFTVQITPPTGWRNTASAQACVDIADENGTGFKQVKVSTGGAGWMDVTEQAESGSFDLDVYDNGTLTVRVIDRQDGYHDGTAKIMCFDRTAPTVTAGISGEPLHIEAKDDLSGVAGIQVNGLLFTTLDGGKLDIHFNEVETLKSYEKLVVRAYDCAGNFSEAVTLKNPYYGQATSKPTTVPTATPRPASQADTEAGQFRRQFGKRHIGRQSGDEPADCTADVRPDRYAHACTDADADFRADHRTDGAADRHAGIHPDRSRSGVYGQRQHAHARRAVFRAHEQAVYQSGNQEWADVLSGDRLRQAD